MDKISLMPWSWQQSDWPRFTYDRERMAPCEAELLELGGVLLGAFKHLDTDDRQAIAVELLTDEAVTTSSIEGEVLDRESVRSSLRRQLGLQADASRVRPNEQGIAQMVADIFRDPLSKVTHETLFRWHAMLMQGREQLGAVGAYRAHVEPMQIVSGRIDRPEIHFEAPPSSAVPAEMSRFLDWLDEIEFSIAKTKLLDRLRDALNARREKALLRVLSEGPGGFAGGLSSAKYQSITRASPATAGRDLAELVELGALRKTGTGKGTRYWVVLPGAHGDPPSSGG